MATLTVSASPSSVSLQSSWQCEKTAGVQKKEYEFKSGPTVGSASATFSYSLPSGAQITGATLTASLGSPLSGISFCKANGSSFRGSMSVSLGSSSGSFTVNFEFKANGTKTDTVSHVAALTISGLSLSIEYEGEEEEQNDEDTSVSDYVFNPPPSSVLIYDTDDGKSYMFDGVTKIQEEVSVKIEEDPSTKKELYVNNARNEPDKVKFDIMMSDVYTGGTYLVDGNLDRVTDSYAEAYDSSFLTDGNTRSSAAMVTFITLKENRHNLTIYTPQAIFSDMLLQDLTITQDSSCPFGWSGQISFQGMYETETKTDATSSTADSSNVQQRVPSMWYTLFYG